jgi:hypothetical protein
VVLPSPPAPLIPPKEPESPGFLRGWGCIEAGEVGDVSWWAFYDQHLATDAEKLMRMAGADDPEAALEVERTEAKDREAA